MQPFCLLYRIALLFRGSLISRISRIWNRSRNLFNENLSHCAVTPRGNTNSRNLFNEFLQSSYSRKFRPAKYKRYTVVMLSSLRRLKCTSIIEKGAGFRKFVLYREVFFLLCALSEVLLYTKFILPPLSLSLSSPLHSGGGANVTPRQTCQSSCGPELRTDVHRVMAHPYRLCPPLFYQD